MDRSNYKYQLAGMVIHSGTAHAGHYYSFIRERLGNKLVSWTGARCVTTLLSLVVISQGNWMTFNDSSVTPFNPDYIEREVSSC